MIDLKRLKTLASRDEAETKKFFSRLGAKRVKELDEPITELHEQVFKEINCLECANCCKSISPIIFDKDIERMSKHLRMKSSAFIEKYLMIDSDKDYVFQDTPCPFLFPDNYCMVYEVRPKSCREYPHTNRKRFYQIISLTIKNTHYCPAVYEIISRLKTTILNGKF